MVSALVVALTIITEGVGISHVGATLKRVHTCHNTGLSTPCNGKVLSESVELSFR
jgi:hypothetical protein